MFLEDVNSLFAHDFHCHPHLIAVHALRMVPIMWKGQTKSHLPMPEEFLMPDDGAGWFNGTDMVDSFSNICRRFFGCI